VCGILFWGVLACLKLLMAKVDVPCFLLYSVNELMYNYYNHGHSEKFQSVSTGKHWAKLKLVVEVITFFRQIVILPMFTRKWETTQALEIWMNILLLPRCHWVANLMSWLRLDEIPNLLSSCTPSSSGDFNPQTSCRSAPASASQTIWDLQCMQ